jgi:hypothetical protein
MNATNRLNSKYIAVKINDGSKNLLSNYASVEPTYKDEDYTAVEARELIEYGMLDGGKSVTYNIKLWMDESVTINDDAMNKSFDSKISVVASQETFNPVLARYITDLALTDKTNLVIDDETADHNTRYIGSDPDNYLCFDSKCTNGKWRVIGVMNNMTTSEGETKSLVKIIRNYSIGTYSWDNDNINDWTTSSSNNYLNGDWYDSNLADYDDLIESVVWGLGGYSKDTIIASDFYSYERNTIVYSDRPTEWTGKVALIYPSDYGYATSGGDIGRETCLTYNLGNWSSYDDCKKFDFVYNSANTWTLMPNLSSKNIFLLDVTGNILYYADSSSSANIKPSLYLKDNAKILSGSGTNIDPWIIGL